MMIAGLSNWVMTFATLLARKLKPAMVAVSPVRVIARLEALFIISSVGSGLRTRFVYALFIAAAALSTIACWVIFSERESACPAANWFLKAVMVAPV